MGECGCGDTRALVRFAGPDGLTYTLDVYAGCSYCDTPAGVVIHRVNDAGAAWGFGDLPELRFEDWSVGGEHYEAAIVTVVHPKHIAAALDVDLDSLEDLDVEGEMPAAVEEAVHASVREWLAEFGYERGPAP